MALYIRNYAPVRWEEEQRPAERVYKLAVNVREEENGFELIAFLPGLKPEDLNIQVLDNVVSIEGRYPEYEEPYLLRELPVGHFRRVLEFAVPLDASKAEAQIKDGILNLYLPKADAARPKSIKIVRK